ncbi:MAG: Do family serine endopeptidase [Acidobacteriota bacterium]|nr:Do family serine endopeptidase [Blastocatellia bacterium]MDW8238580.1 Do family serine endopeptidase [Acidobacteriota bacterium]
MEPVPQTDHSSVRLTRSPMRRQVVLSLLVAVGLLIGIGIGIFISREASARQQHRLLQVNRSWEPPSVAVSTALALSEAFAEVARRVEPAVVHIETVAEPTSTSALEPFDWFHGPRRRQRGEGSGVLVDADGYILTNKHVIEDAARMRVRLADGRTFVPQIIGTDTETDLAVLRIKGSAPFSVAPVGDSEALKVGDWVLAIGSPFGLEQSVTAGIISAKDRVTAGPHANFQQFLQTDAAINPGNSGGPLVNLKGEVIGINAQISTSTGVSNGVGFAIPTSIAIPVYNQLVATGKVERGWLGIVLDEVKPEAARVYGLDHPHGALVHDVVSKDSPAAQAGIQSADIIVQFDGQSVRDQRHLTRMVASSPIGRVVPVTVMRDGRRLTLQVKIGPRQSISPSSALPTSAQKESTRTRQRVKLGAKLQMLSAQTARSFNLPITQGVVVSEIEEGSLASELGLQTHDVILRVNRQTIGSIEQLEAIISQLQSGDDLVVEVIGPRRLLDGPGRHVLTTVVP